MSRLLHVQSLRLGMSRCALSSMVLAHFHSDQMVNFFVVFKRMFEMSQSNDVSLLDWVDPEVGITLTFCIGRQEQILFVILSQVSQLKVTLGDAVNAHFKIAIWWLLELLHCLVDCFNWFLEFWNVVLRWHELVIFFLHLILVFKVQGLQAE